MNTLKKAALLTVTALHLLQASWLLEGGLDLLLRAPLASEQRCAPHGCGCEASAVARGACCCGPETPREAAPSPGAALLAQARCQGGSDDAPLLTQIQALAAFPSANFPQVATIGDAVVIPAPVDAAPARRVLKVPIA